MEWLLYIMELVMVNLWMSWRILWSYVWLLEDTMEYNKYMRIWNYFLNQMYIKKGKSMNYILSIMVDRITPLNRKTKHPSPQLYKSDK